MVDLSIDAESAGREAPEAAIVTRRAFLSGRRSLQSPQEALQPENAPQPPASPKRKKKPRRPIVSIASGLLSFAGIAAVVFAVAWSLAVQRLQAPGPLPADKVVNVPKTDAASLTDQLADEGVIESKPLMMGALWAEGQRGNIKHGEYLFKQNASLQNVIDTLVSGKQILHALTIPEGLTSQQIVDRLSADDLLGGAVKTVPREGSLMPDTYKFARDFKRDQLIQNMQTEASKIVGEVWSHRSADLPIHSPYELVTLASIVEKETGRADERPRVAGVFINRLMRGMPLQSDPTIVYGLVGGKGTLGRGITRSELDQKTPYNTYTIPGLPPGPIANPGRAALEAVANPSRTRELYFVADGTGGHAFAENLDQHRQNVARYRQIEKDAKDKLDSDADKAAPAAAPAAPAAPRPNQRGDGGGSAVYGVLGGSFPGDGRPAIAAFPVTGLTGSALAAVPVNSPLAAASKGNLDELDIEVAGVRSKEDPDALADGSGTPVDGADGRLGSMETFPVPAGRLADERAQARALGIQAAHGGFAAQQAAAVAPSAADNPPPVSNERFGKGKIFDASEGTSLDPLKDKSYDLMSAKTVPAMRPLPPSRTLSYAN